jgi:hypothetical protein
LASVISATRTGAAILGLLSMAVALIHSAVIEQLAPARGQALEGE